MGEKRVLKPITWFRHIKTKYKLDASVEEIAFIFEQLYNEAYNDGWNDAQLELKNKIMETK